MELQQSDYENKDDIKVSSVVSRQDIINFPFPYKLWLAVHLEFCDFIRWNRDGTIILIDIVALEEYLNSTKSIFTIKNRSTFLTHLKEFNFERVNTETEQDEEISIQYKHENFLRHRIDLLAKIRRCSNSFLFTATNANEKAHSQQNQLTDVNANGAAAQRMIGDLCFMSHGCLSIVQKKRLRYQTIMNFYGEKKILHWKINGDIKPKHSSMNADAIELPAELFENPHDSVLFMDEYRSEYAGYYGMCSRDQLINFFGEYLPKYQQINEDGTISDSKGTTASCSEVMTSDANETQKNSEMNFDVICSVDFNATDCLPPPPPLTSQSTNHNLIMSSSLEPIYLNLEDDKANQEAEIFMGDFIKFNDASTENSNIIANENDSTAPDDNTMPNNSISLSTAGAGNGDAIDAADEPECPHLQHLPPPQMKIESEDIENEENFRNFFHQYRESLNLLYGKH